MEHLIRATVAASRTEVEAESTGSPEALGLEILETDGFDGETLTIILASAAAVECVRSLRLILVAFLARDRRIRISQGSTEIEVASSDDLELVLDRLTKSAIEACEESSSS